MDSAWTPSPSNPAKRHKVAELCVVVFMGSGMQGGSENAFLHLHSCAGLETVGLRGRVYRLLTNPPLYAYIGLISPKQLLQIFSASWKFLEIRNWKFDFCSIYSLRLETSPLAQRACFPKENLPHRWYKNSIKSLATDKILNWLHSSCPCLVNTCLDCTLQEGRHCMSLIYHCLPGHKGIGRAWWKFVQLRYGMLQDGGYRWWSCLHPHK